MKSLMIALTLGACVLSNEAKAVLGENVSSIKADHVALTARKSTSVATSSYTVHELTTDSGTVREFVAPNGVVFAVAWHGLTHPDLSILLGSYFSEYQTGLQRTPKKHGRKPHQLQTASIVVEKSGHMRSLRGRAFLKNQLPPGINKDEIR